MSEPLLFFGYWLINSLVLFLFGKLLPDSIVLGNFRLVPFEAAIFSGFWTTFFFWCLREYIYVKEYDFGSYESELIFSISVNVLGIWLVSRYGEYSGFGIVNFGWAFLLGVVISFFQRYLDIIDDSLN